MLKYIRNKVKQEFILKGCGNPPLLINGAYESERQINHVNEVDQTITYSCVDGFQLLAPLGKKSICLIGNKWSLEKSASDFPRCEPGKSLFFRVLGNC